MVAHGQMLQMQAWRFKGMSGASSATFSPCGRYRYDLRRSWDTSRPPLVCCALNPSSADAFKDDPSVRRMISFASAWGAGGLILANIFALRSTDPKGLLAVDDPVGGENDATIERVFRTHQDSRLVLCWGHHGQLHGRGRTIAEMAWDLHGAPECFGLTQNGQPRHPLYVSGKTPTQFFPRGAR